MAMVTQDLVETTMYNVVDSLYSQTQMFYPQSKGRFRLLLEHRHNWMFWGSMRV